MNKFNETPAFMACEHGAIDILTVLAKNPRCNLGHEDKFGDTVLHVACRDG